MFDSAFEIDQAAVIHCRYRIDTLVEKKENIEIKRILEEELKEKLELIDEIIDCHKKKNEKQKREQWDRYQIPICKALLLFRQDLEKSSQIISQFGSEKVKFVPRTTEEKLRKLDLRLGSFREIITSLEKNPKFGYPL